jgi:hypothetical protein
MPVGCWRKIRRFRAKLWGQSEAAVGTCCEASWRKRAALIYIVVGLFVVQLAMRGHVICSAMKTTLPAITWAAICITIPLIGYAFWLLEKDQKN